MEDYLAEHPELTEEQRCCLERHFKVKEEIARFFQGEEKVEVKRARVNGVCKRLFGKAWQGFDDDETFWHFVDATIDPKYFATKIKDKSGLRRELQMMGFQ